MVEGCETCPLSLLCVTNTRVHIELCMTCHGPGHLYFVGYTVLGAPMRNDMRPVVGPKEGYTVPVIDGTPIDVKFATSVFYCPELKHIGLNAGTSHSGLITYAVSTSSFSSKTCTACLQGKGQQ